MGGEKKKDWKKVRMFFYQKCLSKTDLLGPNNHGIVKDTLIIPFPHILMFDVNIKNRSFCPVSA